MNATLKATLGGLADESARVDDESIRLRADLRPSAWREVADSLKHWLCLPEIDKKALAGLKFSEALPRHLAVATLATRLADVDHSRIVLTEDCRFEQLSRPLESLVFRTYGDCVADVPRSSLSIPAGGIQRRLKSRSWVAGGDIRR